MKTIIITIQYKKIKGERTECTLQCGGITSKINQKMAEKLVEGEIPKQISEEETHSILTCLLKVN